MEIKRHTQFLLDKEKGKDDAKIRYRIKWNGNVVAFNVGYRVYVEKWDLGSQRCKSNTTNKKKQSASVINREIQAFEVAADNVFKAFEVLGKYPSTDEFRSAFNAMLERNKPQILPPEKGFFEIMGEFVDIVGFQNNWTKATIKKFNSLKNHVFKALPGVSLENITEESLNELIQYFNIKEHKNTTISKYLSLFKWFLRWSNRKGYYSGNLHDAFRPKLKGIDGNNRDVIHLSWNELMTVYSFDIPESLSYLEKIRDSFCFCCFTGLRYSDLVKLMKSDIKTNHITVVTQKTSDSLKIELNKYSKAILEKYKKTDCEKGRALPVISNQKMNDFIKVLGELCEIKEPQRIVYFKGNERYEEVYPKYALLTTHCGRRTFIVNALTLGIPIHVIIKWTGHSDYKAMQPYIKIVDELKVSEMSKFDVKEVPASRKKRD